MSLLASSSPGVGSWENSGPGPCLINVGNLNNRFWVQSLGRLEKYLSPKNLLTLPEEACVEHAGVLHAVVSGELLVEAHRAER